MNILKASGKVLVPITLWMAFHFCFWLIHWQAILVSVFIAGQFSQPVVRLFFP